MKNLLAIPILAALLTLLAVLLAPDACAQHKLYRWTDAEGNVHYTDHLPPEAVKEHREELNRQGMTIRTTERARTPEEQAAWEAEQEKLAEERRIAEEKAKMDAVLLGSYATETALIRAYDERFDLLDQSLESTRVSIRSQEKSLVELLQHAAELERDNKPVPKQVRASIELARNQARDQREYLQRREAEQTELRREFESRLTRYRELKLEQEERAAAN